ncbi:MAG: sulfite exporter TauE/SafE family protein [Thermoplasmata archaeon]|nr:sulfite exporter TauE/SafE family protein [Thermoplasmata archaeon]
MWLLVIGILAVFGIAFIYSNLGMGGGILFVPLLFWLTLYGEDQVVVISLCLVVANSLTALMNHQREKLVDWKLGAILATGAIVGAIIGTEFNLATGKEIFLVIFLAVVIIVIIKMLLDWKKQKDICEIDDDRKLTKKRLILASFGTIGAGFMAGCLGLGGGVINVPILMYVLGRSTKKAAGTSFIIMIIASLVSLSVFTVGGTSIEWIYVVALAPVVFLGSFIGSRWGIKKLKCREVQLLFILVLIIAILKVGYDFIQIM